MMNIIIKHEADSFKLSSLSFQCLPPLPLSLLQVDSEYEESTAVITESK